MVAKALTAAAKAIARRKAIAKNKNKKEETIKKLSKSSKGKKLTDYQRGKVKKMVDGKEIPLKDLDKKPDLMTSKKAKKMVDTKGGYKTKSKRANAKTKGKQTEFERGTAATAKRGSIAKSPVGFNKIKTAKEFTKANNRLRALGNRVGPLSKAEQAEVKRLKKLVADYERMKKAETRTGRKTQVLAADKRRKNKSKITLAADFKPKKK